jgi:hypothetical protein
MAIITIAASKPNVRFCSTIPGNFPKKKPPTQNLKEETQAETQETHNIKENKVSRSMPKFARNCQNGHSSSTAGNYTNNLKKPT